MQEIIVPLWEEGEKMRRLFLDFFTSAGGASSVEYAVLASLIIGVLISVIAILGLKVLNLFQSLSF
jgi:Flp pilus assembly pilin Flp